MTNLINTYTPRLQLWKIEEVTQKIPTEAKQIWIYITLYMFTATTLSFIITLSYVIPTAKDKDLIFFFKIVEIYFPQWENYMVWTIKVMLLVGIYVGVSIPVFPIFYLSGHFTLQKMMFVHHLHQINSKHTKLKYLKSNYVEYHREIETKLTLCVQNHAQFSG